MMALGLGGRRSRTLLAIAGVAVATAMLLDMVMLASGMRVSFEELLVSRGFQIRVAPRGTLPFDTDATIGNARDIERRLAATHGVQTVSPVLAGQLHIPRGESTTVAAIALGVRPLVQGDYDLVQGRHPAGDREMVVSDDLLRALGARLGDTVTAAAQYDPQLRSLRGERLLTITGRARFLYLSAGQRAAALPLETLQAMRGAEGADRVSLFMARLDSGVAADSVRARIHAAVPAVTAISVDDAIRQVTERLSYFRQLAFILGAVSLIVGFLLVTTIVTVTVNERIGEIAVLRAIGVTRARVVRRIQVEGLLIMIPGSILGLALGLATARYLNGILADFPGLPEAIDFFVFEPRAAWSALGLMIGAGLLAGIYPAWRAAALPIAVTLREEAVG